MGKMRAVLAMLVVTGMMAVGASTAQAQVASAADGYLCAKNTFGGDMLVVRNMGCAPGRDIVRTWGVRFCRDRRVNRPNVRGFRCRGRSDSVEGLTVTCRNGQRSVSFYANVPC